MGAFIRLMTCVCTLGCLNLTWAFADDQFTQVLEYRSPATLGLGWNSLTNQSSDARMSCLEEKSYTTHESQGGNYSGSFRLVSSRSDIEDSLGLNASASYRGLVYQASGSVQFAKSQTLSTGSIQVAGFATAETRVQSLLGKGNTEGLKADAGPSDEILPLSTIQRRQTGLRIAPKKLRLLTSGKPKDAQKFFGNVGMALYRTSTMEGG